MKRLLLALALSGCGGGLNASSDSQRCLVASDCVAVFSGDLCSGCGCPNEAINVSDQRRSEADPRASTALCSPLRPRCLADCIQVFPSCSAGRCTLAQQPSS